MPDFVKTYELMRDAYEQAFSTTEKRAMYCPVKDIKPLKRVDGIVVESMTKMYGTTLNGNYGEKWIYVNDETKECSENVFIETEGHTVVLDKSKPITPFRCGIMTCVAIWQFIGRMLLSFNSVGFIGCGRTNLMNCKAIYEVFGLRKAVIRGSHRDYGKNASEFNKIVPTCVDFTDDMRLLNRCDVVVVCTSNYEKSYLIDTTTLWRPKLIIVLDCGYTLDESFRNEAISYTDYKEQIMPEYRDEFPFDKDVHQLRQLVEDMDRTYDKRVCVYLHGIGFADVTIAEMIAKSMHL